MTEGPGDWETSEMRLSPAPCSQTFEKPESRQAWRRGGRMAAGLGQLSILIPATVPLPLACEGPTLLASPWSMAPRACLGENRADLAEARTRPEGHHVEPRKDAQASPSGTWPPFTTRREWIPRPRKGALAWMSSSHLPLDTCISNPAGYHAGLMRVRLSKS